MFIINIFYLFTVDILYIYKSRKNIMLLLLLSHFSRVRLCATPQTAAHQALPSLGFSRRTPVLQYSYWSGLPLPSPMHESEQ